MPALALTLLLASCGSGQFSNPFATTFSVTATPINVTATTKAPGHASLTATDGIHPVTGLNISATSVPDGLNVAVNGSSVTVTPKTITPAGAYPVTLHATAPGGSGDVVLNVTVNDVPLPSYSVTVTPVAASTAQGTSVHVAATITPDAGYTNTTPVKVIRIDGSAPGITVVSDSTGATLSAAVTAAVGQYGYSLITSDGKAEKSTPFSLSVTAPSN